MDDRDHRRSTAFLVGVITVAAGIAAASYLYWWRVRAMKAPARGMVTVADILTECHAKMREIQSHLSVLGATGT
jgi:hypothetical protein